MASATATTFVADVFDVVPVEGRSGKLDATKEHRLVSVSAAGHLVVNTVYRVSFDFLKCA